MSIRYASCVGVVVIVVVVVVVVVVCLYEEEFFIHAFMYLSPLMLAPSSPILPGIRLTERTFFLVTENPDACSRWRDAVLAHCPGLVAQVARPPPARWVRTAVWYLILT